MQIKAISSLLRTTTVLFLSGLAIACGSPENKSEIQGNAAASQQGVSNNPATTPTPVNVPSQSNSPANAIPDFNFYILKSGISFTKNDLGASGPHVFILFDPSCGYCQHEARDIGANLDKLTDANFYFVSMNDPGLMATFFDRFAKELNGQSKVHMLYDRNIEFINKFHVPTQYPATYIYGSDGLLKTYWNGVKTAEEVVASINSAS